MGAVRMVLFAEARHRWRSWLALALLVGVVSGVAMAAATAARRTESAFPRYLATYGYDAEAYALGPVPAAATLPGVTDSQPLAIDGTGTPSCSGCSTIDELDFGAVETPPHAEQRVFRLVSGRLPDPASPNQVLASFTLQAKGVHLGSVVRVPFYGPGQSGAITGTTVAAPRGPTVDLRVVGFEAAVFEFPSIGAPSYDLWTTPAFARRYGPRILKIDIYLLRLRQGALGQSRFTAELAHTSFEGSTDLDTSAAEVETSLHPQAVGWWVLAALAAAAGLLAVAQAFGRQTRVMAETYPALSAVGVDRNELVAMGVARSAVVGALGAAIGVALAVALSPLTPVGEARTADPTSGLAADALVLGTGAAAAIVASVAVALWPSLRAARLRRPERPPQGSSVIVNGLAAAGAPPTAVIGVRRVLERGRGRAAVPVGTAIVGTILAVLGLTATAVFGASLSHLTSTPALYGQRFDVWFSGAGSPTGQHQLLDQLLPNLRSDPGIAAVTLGASAQVEIDGRPVDTIAGVAAKGPLLMSTIDGHLPSRPGQIALGETTLRQVGAHIGSRVTVTAALSQGGSRRSVFDVVGTVAFPTDFGIGGLGNGAITSLGGLAAAQCQPGSGSCVAAAKLADEQVLLVQAAPGRRGEAALSADDRRYSNLVSFPTPPTDLVNFGEAVNFPLIVGVVLALFGASTLLHMLVVSTARRRPETGLLKALGFSRSQISVAVAWQATTLALLGVVVGVPLGIATGEAVWRLFAENQGVVPVAVVGVEATVLVAAGVVVLANLLALGPAIASSRLRPSELLRTD